MKGKRIVCLILAVLMVMGTITWLITMIASADTSTGSELVACRLDAVYPRSSGDACYIKGDSNKTAYQIKKGYYADFTVSVKYQFENTVDAQTFGGQHQGNLKADVDSGSFSRGSVSSVVIQSISCPENSKVVTVTVSVGKVQYSGEGNTLGLTLYDDSYTGTFSIDIAQCVPYEKTASSADDDDDDEKDIPDPTPYVIVSGYDYGGGNVTAGQEFTLNLKIENTSSIPVGNMTMTVTTPDSFTLVNSSNTVYIESLGAHQSFTHSIRMMARASADPEPAVVDVGFHYQYISNDDRLDVDRSEKIAIPVSQRDRFEVENFTLPEQLWVGEEYDLEVKYINKGRSTVYNLSAVIEGENLAQPHQSENVGNLESGRSGTIDFFLMANTPGILSGNVVITYEDINMNEKTITMPFSVNVVDMDEPVYDPSQDIIYNEDGSYYGPDGQLYGPDGQPIQESSGGWKTYAIVGGCVLAGLAALIVVAKKRKAARLLAELEEDNNEDS